MWGDRYENQMAHVGSMAQLKKMEELYHPFNKLVRVAVLDDDGQEIYYGTGTLLIACYVLTSFHLITKKVRKRTGNDWKYIEEPRPTALSAKNIKVFIGQNGEKSPGLKYNVLSLAYPEEYLLAQVNLRFLYDYTILKIDLTQNNLEDNTLKLSIPTINKLNRMVELYGYDKNYNQDNFTSWERQNNIHTLYGCKTDLLKVDQFTIKYKVPTDGGKSGAPLVSYSEQSKYKIIGIHIGAYTDVNTNFALRITHEIITKITKLIQQLNQGTRVQRRNIENLNMTNESFHQKQMQGDLNEQVKPDSRSQKLSEKQKLQETELPHRLSLPVKSSETNVRESFDIKVNQILFNFFNFHQETEVYEDQAEMQKNRSQLRPRHIIFPLGALLIFPQYQPSPASAVASSSLAQPPTAEANRPGQTINEIQVNNTPLKEINDLASWISPEKRMAVKTLAFNFWYSQVCLQQFFDINLLLRLDNINNLRLTHCQLQSIPKLSQLQNLQRIDCSNNYISQIDNFYTPIISHIFLNDNCVIEISEKIIDALSLKTLEIRYNRRALKVHDNIASLPNLRELRLDGAPELTISREVKKKLQDQDNETLERFEY